MAAESTRGRALVTGASIAGPAAAYWLDRVGYDVTVVEQAPSLREGGQNLDVRATGREVLRRMGLEDRVRELTTGEVGTRFVEEDGSTVSEFPVQEGEGGDSLTAELEVLRGDLAGAVVEACSERVEWRYDDRVEAVEEGDGAARVRFAGGAEEEYSVVVVAEGVRSRTRDLVLGEPELDRLGMYMVYGTIARTEGDDDWWRWFAAPGARQATLRPDQHGTTRATLAFRADPIGLETADRATQLRTLRQRFAGLGWEVPRILDGFERSDDVYVEDLTQVHADSWVRGRVGLTGDAAWCVTPIGGGGASLALVGGYVLAAYLSQHEPGDEPAALAEYERWVRPLADDAQSLPPGTPALATPRSRAGVTLLQLATKVAASGPAQRLASRLSSGPEAAADLPGIRTVR